MYWTHTDFTEDSNTEFFDLSVSKVNDTTPSTFQPKPYLLQLKFYRYCGLIYTLRAKVEEKAKLKIYPSTLVFSLDTTSICKVSVVCLRDTVLGLSMSSSGHRVDPPSVSTFLSTTPRLTSVPFEKRSVVFPV